ncbi:hypothetical protein [Streptomyces sp. cg36]|uniref:hypothetical protein n=1 Tax=Streptomyces sp. cg36 TaxID=3238798 RepID=UPI0034E20C11
MHLDRARREPHRLYAAVRTIKRLLENETIPQDIARLRIALDHGERLMDERTRERTAILRQLQDSPTALLLAKADRLMGDENVSIAEREILRHAREKYRSVRSKHHRMEEERNAARRVQQEQQRHQVGQQDKEERRRQAEQRKRARAQEEAEHRERAERAEAERRAAALQAEKEHAEKLAYLTPFVLGALKKAAREERLTAWEELRERTGQRELARLSHADRLTVLEAVEEKTRPDAPLWSSVLAAAGTGEALRLHRDLAERLDRPLPEDDTELLAQVTAECARLRSQW